MTNQELITYITAWNDDAQFSLPAETDSGIISAIDDLSGTIVNVEIPPTHLTEFMKRLQSDPELQFDYLFDMIGMDWGKELGILYYLKSTVLHHKIVVRIKIEDRENPEVDTMENIWKAAHLQEREIFDLFGIRFKGHSNLKRIFLRKDFKGYPLRKDYEDDYMIIRK